MNDFLQARNCVAIPSIHWHLKKEYRPEKSFIFLLAVTGICSCGILIYPIVPYAPACLHSSCSFFGTDEWMYILVISSLWVCIDRFVDHWPMERTRLPQWPSPRKFQAADSGTCWWCSRDLAVEVSCAKICTNRRRKESGECYFISKC